MSVGRSSMVLVLVLAACAAPAAPAPVPGAALAPVPAAAPAPAPAAEVPDAAVADVEAEAPPARLPSPAPVVDAPLDAALRKASLRAIVDGLAKVATPKDGLRLVEEHSSAGSGIRPVERDDFGFDLEPSMKAREFAAAIGQSGVIGQSRGVHMSRWRLVTVQGQRTSELQFGSWLMEATLGGWPSGGQDTRFKVGPTGHKLLGPDDVVVRVRFSRPVPSTTNP